MNVYVIYKFSDYDRVVKRISEIKEAINSVSFYLFEPNRKNNNWHYTAKKKIKKSNLVLFFDFSDGNSEISFKHIKWELKQAEKYNKRIIVSKEDDNSYPSSIYETDYSEQETNRNKYKTLKAQNIIQFFKDETEWCVQSNLINAISKTKTNESIDIPSEDKTLLLEQYRMMIETSEKLMERRQAMVNLYITICTALIAFIGASFGFDNLFISAIIALLSGIIIVVLCYNWHSSLDAYDLNNAGKFEVINQIEKHLPADMFECEYRYNKQKGIRSYSSREKILPVIFSLFGVALIAFSVILFIINY